MKLKSNNLRCIYIMNIILITLQLLALIIGAVATVSTDIHTFIPFVFVPTAAYVLYNAVVQTLMDYCYYFKEYPDIPRHHATTGYRIFKRTKKQNDTAGYKLKQQSYITTAVAVVNIIVQVLLISIYQA